MGGFTNIFLQAFSTVLRKLCAGLLLKARLQRPKETVVVFVEEFKRLYWPANRNMAEDKKLCFVVRV